MFVDIARIRENLNIAGMSFNTSMLLSHKDLMYQKLDGLFSYPKTTTLIESPNLKLIKEKVGAQEVLLNQLIPLGPMRHIILKPKRSFVIF